MPDVFGRGYTAEKVASFSADGAKITFAGVIGEGGTGLLVQTLSLNYTQQISRIYEIGSLTTFLVAGRTQGTLGLSRVLGPRAIQRGFYTKYGNVCQAANNVLNIGVSAGCGSTQAGSAGAMNYKMGGVVITNIGVTVNANDMIINEQVSMMFVSLETDG